MFIRFFKLLQRLEWVFTDCIIPWAYLNVNTAVQTCCALLAWQLVYVTKRQQINMRLLSLAMTRLTLSPPVWEQDDFRWREGVTHRKLSTPLRKDKLTLTYSAVSLFDTTLISSTVRLRSPYQLFGSLSCCIVFE